MKKEMDATDKALELIGQGHTYEEACKMSGAMLYRVLKVIDVSGVTARIEGFNVRKLSQDAERYDLARKLIIEGLTAKEVSKRCKIDEQTLIRWFRRMGTPLLLLRKRDKAAKIQELRKAEPTISQLQASKRLKMNRGTARLYWNIKPEEITE